MESLATITIQKRTVTWLCLLHISKNVSQVIQPQKNYFNQKALEIYQKEAYGNLVGIVAHDLVVLDMVMDSGMDGYYL